jgi:tRNA 2-thiouridine synthesizing protein E
MPQDSNQATQDREHRKEDKGMNSTEQKPTGLPPTDEEGFLTKGDVWSEEVAELLAKILMPGDLTEDHWTVINYMRQYYLEFKSVPPVRKLSRDTGISLRQLKVLFPEGLTRGACRIAGIPRHVIRPSFLYP